MSVKINRYPASEGGNWSINGRNVMTIKVPDVGFTDLHNSYVVFRIEPNVNSVTADGVLNKIICPMVFADLTTGIVGSDSPIYTPCTGQALIRNSRVQYSRAQIQNERIDQNVLSQNMDWYTTTRANQRCSTNLTGACNRNYGTIGASGLPDTPFFQYSRPSGLFGQTGAIATTLSQMRNPDILIPLRHIDQLADGMRQFPMTAFGETQYNIQLENVFNVVSPASMPFILFDTYTALADNPIVGSATIPIILTEEYLTQIRLNDIPIYVGATMNFQYLVTGAEEAPSSVVVIASVRALADGKVGVTFVTPVGTVGSVTDDVIEFQLSYAGYEAELTGEWAGQQHIGYPYPFGQGLHFGAIADWKITNAYVELHELKLTSDQQKLALSALRSMELPFVHCQTVRKNMLLTTTEYCDTVPFDVGCTGLVVMTPQPNTMTSGFDEALQYRYKVNSRDELGRWVIVGPEQETATQLPVGRQLHNYKLENIFSALGKTLKKYDAPAIDYNNYLDTNTHAILPLEIYDNAQNGVVSINLQTGDGRSMQAKTVFWQFLYQKAVVIKNGNVVGVM
jgi:hypothetical protein